MSAPCRLGPAEMLKLKRWNSPTIYNGWEAITRRDRLAGIFNREEARDFMPWMGAMVGRAVTLRIDPADPEHPKRAPQAWDEWYGHLASAPGPKIVVVQDSGKPAGLGSLWGEVSANTHRSLGCVGTIVDGALRDIDEMANAGFKALARRLCVGHLYAWPVEWDIPVEVFGQVVEPGTLVHADKHGFIGIPEEDEGPLLAAVRAMDDAECETLIPAGRFAWGRDFEAVLEGRRDAAARYGELAAKAGRGGGEWR
jgi:4-hydroxy-4-methyl-2-oxoglutarate aldolase